MRIDAPFRAAPLVPARRRRRRAPAGSRRWARPPSVRRSSLARRKGRLPPDRPGTGGPAASPPAPGAAIPGPAASHS